MFLVRLSGPKDSRVTSAVDSELALLPAGLFVLWSSLKPTHSPSSLASQCHWLPPADHGLCSSVAGPCSFQVSWPDFLVSGLETHSAAGGAVNECPGWVEPEGLVHTASRCSWPGSLVRRAQEQHQLWAEL